MYAVIATGGKQYKVTTGDKVRVEKLDAEVGSKVTIDQVLMVSADKVTVGSPYVDGASVEAEVTDQGKAKKVVVYKYKPKTGYHKKNGHRQLYTELTIEKVILNGVELINEVKEEPEEEKKPAKKKEKKERKSSKEAVTEKAEEAVSEAEEKTDAAEAVEEVKEEAVDAVEEVVEEATEAAEEATEAAAGTIEVTDLSLDDLS